MYKKLLISLLAVSSFVYYQSSHAHGEKQDSVDTEAKRAATEKQQDKESWDDFMSAINSQKKDDSTEKKPEDHDEHHDRSGQSQ